MVPVGVRSVSPMHIQYLQNMKVRATFVVSIMVDGELWGLVACHHYSGPKQLSLLHRNMAEVAAKIASLAIGAHRRLDYAESDQHHLRTIQDLHSKGLLDRPTDLDSEARAELLGMTRSQGAVLVTELGVFR